jgi:hypothetical protein
LFRAFVDHDILSIYIYIYIFPAPLVRDVD